MSRLESRHAWCILASGVRLRGKQRNQKEHILVSVRFPCGVEHLCVAIMAFACQSQSSVEIGQDALAFR